MTVVPKPRLLVVDDEPDMLEFVERVARRRFDVTPCSSAEVALAELASGDYEVLVTDQKMPKVSGLELLARISTLYPRLVRVLLSGFTDLPDIQRAIAEAHVHAYVVKPVDSHRLLAAIEQAYAVRDGAPFVSPVEA